MLLVLLLLLLSLEPCLCRVTQNDKGEPVRKVVFIIFYRATSLTPKLQRICDAFTATRHDLPHFDDPSEVSRVSMELQTGIQDSLRVLEENKNLTYVALRNMSGLIAKWKMGVMREKSISHTLNLFEPYTQGMLRGQAWVLEDALPFVTEALASVHAGSRTWAGFFFFGGVCDSPPLSVG